MAGLGPSRQRLQRGTVFFHFLLKDKVKNSTVTRARDRGHELLLNRNDAMAKKINATAASHLGKNDLIVIGGAGGFIGGAPPRCFHEQGFTRIRGPYVAIAALSLVCFVVIAHYGLKSRRDYATT